MSVIQAYPLKNLRMRGGLGPLQGEPATGVLTVTLEEIKGGTRIRWEYVVGGYMRYDVETIAKAVDGVMSQQLAGLRDHLGALEGVRDHLGALEGEGSEPEPVEDPEEEPSIETQIDALQGAE